MEMIWWKGGRRHISSLVPSLYLETRSGAWGEGGGKGMEVRKGTHRPCDSPMPGEKFSGSGSLCQGQG